MLKKILGSLFKTLWILGVVLFLSSCAKTNYDGSAPIQPFGNTSQQIPPEATKEPEPITPIVETKKFPIISFVLDEVSMNQELEAQLELQLSEASNLPVIAVVNLVSGTAIPHRDFNGFKPYSSARFSRTVVIPPGTTRVALPLIGGRRTYNCDSHFFAEINPQKLQQAKVLEKTAKIFLPCEFAELPEVEPIPEPIPQPIPELPVRAYFQHDYIKTKEHKKRTSVKILLTRASSLPVVLDLETQNGTAFEEIDYVKVKNRLVIPPGQVSIEVPIQLVRAHRCKPKDDDQWWPHDGKYKFHVVVTAIANAEMLQPRATIRVTKDVDNHHGCKSPPLQ